MSKQKLRAFCVPSAAWPDAVIGYTINEEGNQVASHLSSHEGWAKHDLGVEGSDWAHDTYNHLYPDGWTIEWVTEVPSDFKKKRPEDY